MHGTPKLTNRNEAKQSFSRLFIKFGCFWRFWRMTSASRHFWRVGGTEDDVATDFDCDVSGREVGRVVT